MLDLDDLLQSLGDDAPCGPDLEYDVDYTALSLANEPGEERVVGDSVIAAEEPDFAEVEALGISLLQRTKDLRVAVMIANASLRTNGLPAFEQMLLYIRRCLEDYWDCVHPQLDEEDDNDPTMRVNAVRGLVDRDTVLASLRLAPLTDSRAFGQYSLRDLLVAKGEISAPSSMDEVPTPQVISAAFQDTDKEQTAKLLETISASLEHVKAIAAIFDEQVGSLGPDLDPLQSMIFDIKRQISSYADIDGVNPEEDAAGHAGADPRDGAAAVSSSAPSPAGSGAIHSPEDVKKAIDRIVDYYARNEPSSPVPLLLNRARRLISADFFTIMQDMAPQGVENVALIGGIEESDD